MFIIALVTAPGCSKEPSFDELMDGVPLDPSEYELTQECVTGDDGEVRVEATITNTSDRGRGYRLRYFYTKPDGTDLDLIAEGQAAEPGETLDISAPLLRADAMAAPPDCGVEILITALEGLD